MVLLMVLMMVMLVMMMRTLGRTVSKTRLKPRTKPWHHQVTHSTFTRSGPQVTHLKWPTLAVPNPASKQVAHSSGSFDAAQRPLSPPPPTPHPPPPAPKKWRGEELGMGDV